MERESRRGWVAVASAALIALGGACGDGSDTSGSGGGSAGAGGAVTGMSGTSTDPGTSGANSEPEESAAELAARGERIYNVNCIACHHRDPTQDGGLGPPVAGSSRELIEARVMRGEYPPGYTPKADTKLMIPLPHLEPELDSLAAFLASRAN